MLSREKHVGMLRQYIDWLESGEETPADLIDLCLKRIAEREPELRAWVEVSPQEAVDDGPLYGVPFGVKDIYETRGLATEFGSPIFAGRKGQTDAVLVTRLRDLGAVLIGKTQTTAFASFDPSPTRNPCDPRYTPGGSSSGSAAAVAAGMVPFAFGSQTQGSVLRPASFCGIVGFKPTYGLLSLAGVLPFAPSLDTAGFFTQTADDMHLLWSRMGFRGGASPARAIGAPDALDADPEMASAFRRTIDQLKAAGYGIRTIELPLDWPGLLAASRLVNQYEGSRTHEAVWRQQGARLGLRLAQLISDGLKLPESRYHEALGAIAEMKQEMNKLFREYPVILTPAAPGPAPLGLDSTGDPRLNAPWTALGTPAISIPMSHPGPLPLGLQITAQTGDDMRLLDFAVSASKGIGYQL
jgi:Asp-tRNA(Asn)/Glu-tRNA(Gln) amidotransferase A subunit family amidase